MTKIVFAPFPLLDQDRTKNRPLLVLAASEDKYDSVIVAYITSKDEKNINQFDFQLNHSQEYFTATGLEKDSLIRLSKIGSIQKSSIKNELGTLPDSALIEIKHKLRKLFNL